MAKIFLKFNLNDSVIYEGKAILKDNVITFNNGVLTKIILGDVIWLIRQGDYFLKLGFCRDNDVKGAYIISEGNLETKTEVLFFKRSKNSIKIKYRLIINGMYIDTFILNLYYLLDS